MLHLRGQRFAFRVGLECMWRLLFQGVDFVLAFTLTERNFLLVLFPCGLIVAKTCRGLRV